MGQQQRAGIGRIDQNHVGAAQTRPEEQAAIQLLLPANIRRGHMLHAPHRQHQLDFARQAQGRDTRSAMEQDVGLFTLQHRRQQEVFG
jgi:hypothetical protein